jgi:Pheophorbide a oxygenase
VPWLQGQRAEACKNHLHQMHICLPSRKGHTRLLYRMSLDFMNWTRFVPGIQIFWQNIANQVRGWMQAPGSAIAAAWDLRVGSQDNASMGCCSAHSVAKADGKPSEAVCRSAC